MATITYQYGIDEAGKCIHISEVDSATHRGRVFRCLSCGGELIAKISDTEKAHTKSSHFAHKHICECNKESYLHKLGKLLFLKRFESEEPIKICVPIIKVCPDRNSCPLHDTNKCRIDGEKPIDLRKYYDKCTEEKEHDGFRADLLLENSKKPNIQPVFIEIVYTHKSTQQKIDSKNKIIEIDVYDESQLKSIFCRALKESECIHFYNFERKTTEEWKGDHKRYLNHFILFNDGSIIANPNDRLTSCKDRNITNPSALAEFLFDTNDQELRWISAYEIGSFLARKAGYTIKNCMLCKYHVKKGDFTWGNNRLCCNLHHKFDTPYSPDWTYAKTCQYFRVDKEQQNLIEKKADAITYAQIK